MKKQVKSFGMFINENDEFKIETSEPWESDWNPRPTYKGIASYEIHSNSFATFSVVSFDGKEIELEDREDEYDEDGYFLGLPRIFRAAQALGASPEAIYSVEDEKIIYAKDVL